MIEELKFTKEQVEYLQRNLRWLHNKVLDKWLAELPVIEKVKSIWDD